MSFRSICRPCVASSSRVSLTSNVTAVRRFSAIPPERSEPAPFFHPPFGALGSTKPPEVPYFGGNGAEKEPLGPKGPGEEEVDDREWEIRVARGVLHLQDSLPNFFSPDSTGATMFPPDVFSRNIVLKLPAPLPLGVPGLTAYSMAFALTKSGLQALHTDVRTQLERLTFTPDLKQTLPSAKPTQTCRQKQVRVLLGVSGKMRLAPHNATTWKTSSLYTFSPYSGLIVTHEVESIRPLPGEGVAEWLRSRLLGWTAKDQAEPIPCPRAVPVPTDADLAQLRATERRRD